MRGPRQPVALLLAVAALLAGCSGAPGTARGGRPAESRPTFGAGPPSWVRCESGFECAALPVPLADTGRTVDLALTRRPATGPGQRLGSLVVNPGGPGAGAVGYLQSAYAGLPRLLRERFDLVAFDPRGVGRTAPVRCASTAELDRYLALDPAPDDAAELTAYERGNEALTAGCAGTSRELLAHVSTAEAAEDLDRVRAAVGDSRLTYLGYSYGTAIGAAYLEAHPTRVRAMVLDGALDPASTWDALLEGQSRGFDTALQALLSDCERTRCAFRQAVGGDLLAAYDALDARIDRTRLPGRDGRTVGPGEFSLAVGAGLYDREDGWPAVAAALAAAERGDGAPLLALSDSYSGRGPQGYANTLEANLAVTCTDRPWPRDTAPYLALADRVARVSPRFGAAIALSGLACATWPVPPTGVPHPVRAAGAPPVVVVGTTRDPATPYAWAVSLARQLASGVLVTYNGDGHTVYGGSAPPCVREPLDAYLLTGTAPPQGLRC